MMMMKVMMIKGAKASELTAINSIYLPFSYTTLSLGVILQHYTLHNRVVQCQPQACIKEDGDDKSIFHTLGTLVAVWPRYCTISNFSSVRRSPTMMPQQDFSKSFCSCCCPLLLSCSFLVPLGLLSHHLFTSLVAFLCFLFPTLVRIAVVCF